MQLRNLTVPAGAAFAPMAGLSDAACRRLMADHGAAWTVSEMASAKGDHLRRPQERRSAARTEIPTVYTPCSCSAAKPETIGRAVEILLEKGLRFDILDINMGCPAPKITSGGAGSKLLLDPARCGAIVKAAREALGGERPLTVKMRIGWDADHLTGPAVAKACEENGGRPACCTRPHAGTDVHPAD